jgi:hypothetical protein
MACPCAASLDCLICSAATGEIAFGFGMLSGYSFCLRRRSLPHQPQSPTAAIGMALWQMLRLLTRERRRQLHQFSAVLSQIRVLGPLGIQEKVFSRIRKFVAASQVPPPVRNPQMNGFQMLRRDGARLLFSTSL